MACQYCQMMRAWRADGKEYETIVSTSLTGVPVQSQDSAHHDRMVREMGE